MLDINIVFKIDIVFWCIGMFVSFVLNYLGCNKLDVYGNICNNFCLFNCKNNVCDI